MRGSGRKFERIGNVRRSKVKTTKGERTKGEDGLRRKKEKGTYRTKVSRMQL